MPEARAGKGWGFLSNPEVSTALGGVAALAARLPAPVWRFAVSKALPTARPGETEGLDARLSQVRSSAGPAQSVSGIHSAGAVYTVRAIYLDQPVPLGCLDAVGGATPEECEHSFRVMLTQGGGLKALNRVVAEGYDPSESSPFGSPETGFKMSQQNRNLTKFSHEYAHWVLTRGTTLSGIIESNAWRLRVLRLALCERIHQATSLPRRFDEASVNRIRKEMRKFQSSISAVWVEGLEEVYLDMLVTQDLLLFRLQPALTLLIEPVTWALVEEEPWSRKAVSDYFHGEEEKSLALRILEESVRLNKGRASRARLVHASRSALNADRREFEAESGSRPGLQRLIARGFIAALKADTPEEAHRARAPQFAESLTSGFHFGPKTKALLASMSRSIISREGELFGYLVSMVARSANTPVDVIPTVLVNTTYNGRPLKLRYDWLTWLTAEDDRKSPIAHRKVSATGEPLNLLDDVVGHLPPSLQMPALILFYRQFLQAEPDETSKRILEMGSGIKNRDVGHSQAFANYGDVAFKVLTDDEYTRGLQYPDLFRSSSMEDYLRLWLQFVADLGPSVRYLFLEHGVGS